VAPEPESKTAAGPAGAEPELELELADPEPGREASNRGVPLRDAERAQGRPSRRRTSDRTQLPSAAARELS